ncbi:hypothetical protein [Weissella confusa]|uniref:hypothetical protein n=1 Tax=Weissella confusa TaxID=1583 RepID=UPI0022E93514|nr:hypothetical protein [Weissella confusa]
MSKRTERLIVHGLKYLLLLCVYSFVFYEAFFAQIETLISVIPGEAQLIPLANWMIRLIGFIVLTAGARTVLGKFIPWSIALDDEVYKESLVLIWMEYLLLGFNKYNPKNISIATQTKLICSSIFIRATNVGELLQCNEAPKVFSYAGSNSAKSLNLCLGDTYDIDLNSLPSLLRDCDTQVVQRSRETHNPGIRVADDEFVEEVVKIIRQANESSKYNVLNFFAHTNPINLEKIVNQSFKIAGRENVISVISIHQYDVKNKRFSRDSVVVNV